MLDRRFLVETPRGFPSFGHSAAYRRTVRAALHHQTASQIASHGLHESLGQVELCLRLSAATQTLFAAGEEVIYNNRDGAMVR
jgi:hypothetical protein